MEHPDWQLIGILPNDLNCNDEKNLISIFNKLYDELILKENELTDNIITSFFVVFYLIYINLNNKDLFNYDDVFEYALKVTNKSFVVKQFGLDGLIFGDQEYVHIFCQEFYDKINLEG